VRQWTPLITRIAPDLAQLPDWPFLAAHLSRAAANGFNVKSRLPLLIADRPLDPDHPIRDINFRLIDACPACHPRRVPHDSSQPQSVVNTHERMNTTDHLRIEQQSGAPFRSQSSRHERHDRTQSTATPRPPQMRPLDADQTHRRQR
jgi:hypothetical protein